MIRSKDYVKVKVKKFFAKYDIIILLLLPFLLYLIKIIIRSIYAGFSGGFFECQWTFFFSDWIMVTFTEIFGESFGIYIFLFTLISSSFLFALEEYYEWLNTVNADIPVQWVERGGKEHYVSIFHRASLIAVGLTYPFGIKEAFLFLIIYWILSDGFMNLLKGRSFFAISTQSGNPFEKYSQWYVKLVLLAVSMFVFVWLNQKR